MLWVTASHNLFVGSTSSLFIHFTLHALQRMRMPTHQSSEHLEKRIQKKGIKSTCFPAKEMSRIWNSRSTVTVHGYDLAIAARRNAMIDANDQHPASSALSILGKCSVTSPISLTICTCVFKFVPTEDVVYSHISYPRCL